VEMLPPHPGRTWTGAFHRPIDIRQLSKTPLLRARCRHLTARPFRRHNLPATWPGLPSGSQAKNKKGLPGDHPRRPVLDEYRPFRALGPPCRYRACRDDD